MENEGCTGCTQQAIANRNQKTITQLEAQKYTNEKKVNTVVYFNGTVYQFCEEQAARQMEAANIIGLYTPQH